MNFEPNAFRRSYRLKGYDYTQPGAYFVTLVTEGRVNRFGLIINGEMCLNPMGQMIQREWNNLSHRFSGLAMDAFVIMPNHLHGILLLGGADPRQEGSPHLGTGSLGVIVRAFKSSTTIRFHRMMNDDSPLWQDNYYERIVRNPDELEKTRNYILTNPVKWEMDQENPERAIR